LESNCNVGEHTSIQSTHFFSANQSIWSPDVAGNDLITLVWEGPLYFIMVLFFDYVGSNPFLFAKIRFMLGKEKDLPSDPEEVDDDVQNEKNDILDGKRDNDPVIVHGVRKVYDGARIAVKDLYFSIAKGQCFGFLGINGAGKSTVSFDNVVTCISFCRRRCRFSLEILMQPKEPQ
jgi:ABC-type multidrug transport system fused ATPase/permease subunit